MVGVGMAVERRGVDEDDGDGLALEGGPPLGVTVGTVQAHSIAAATPSRRMSANRAPPRENVCEIACGTLPIVLPDPALALRSIIPMLHATPTAAAFTLATPFRTPACLTLLSLSPRIPVHLLSRSPPIRPPRLLGAASVLPLAWQRWRSRRPLGERATMLGTLRRFSPDNHRRITMRRKAAFLALAILGAG